MLRRKIFRNVCTMLRNDTSQSIKTQAEELIQNEAWMRLVCKQRKLLGCKCPHAVRGLRVTRVPCHSQRYEVHDKPLGYDTCGMQAHRTSHKADKSLEALEEVFIKLSWAERTRMTIGPPDPC